MSWGVKKVLQMGEIVSYRIENVSFKDKLCPSSRLRTYILVYVADNFYSVRHDFPHLQHIFYSLRHFLIYLQHFPIYLRHNPSISHFSYHQSAILFGLSATFSSICNTILTSVTRFVVHQNSYLRYLAWCTSRK